MISGRQPVGKRNIIPSKHSLLLIFFTYCEQECELCDEVETVKELTYLGDTG